jgi:hypothetical protein
MERIQCVARAIKFKEYLLNRDVSSRRIVIEHCIIAFDESSKIVAWLKNLRSINDQLDSKDRKEQIKVDAYWDDLILEHSKDRVFNTVMALFISSG